MAYDIGPRIGVDGEREFRSQITLISETIKTLDSELRATTSGFEGMTKNQKDAAEKVKTLNEQIRLQNEKLTQQNKALQEATDKYGENSTVTQKWKRTVAESTTELNRMKSELEETQKHAGKLSEALIVSGNKLQALSGKFSSIGNKLTLGVTTPIVGAAAASFKFASDLNENLNKTEVAFGENADAVIQWSKTTLKQFGLSQSTALEMGATWMDMGTSMEIPLDTATDMSKNLVGLSADMASFKNISIERAQTALNGIYTGETEALKGLGIVMTEANLEAYALSKGTETSYKNMDQAQKVSLRYQYVLDKTKNSQGDFSRTSDAAANQMRIAKESAKELAASFGEKLLPVGTKLLQFANGLLDQFNNLDDGTKELIIQIAAAAAALGPLSKGIGLVTQIGGGAIKGIGGLIEKVKGLSGAMSTSAGNVSGLSGALTKFAPYGGPIVLAVGGFAALEFGIHTLMMQTSDYVTETKKVIAEIDKQSEAFRELKDAADKKMDQADSEAFYYQGLYKELTRIVEANGKVKEGYEDRAQFILGELKESYGIESTIVDGVVQKYDTLTKSIENSIDASRAQKLLEANDDVYLEAIQNIQGAEESLNEIRSEYEKYRALVEDPNSSYNAVDSLGHTIMSHADRKEIIDNYRVQQEAYTKALAQYEDYQKTISQYESAEIAIKKGNFKEGLSVLNAKLTAQGNYNNSQYKIKANELENERITNQILLKEYERTGSETVRIQLESSNAKIEALQKEIELSAQTIRDSQNPFVRLLYNFASAASAGYADQLDFEAPTIEQISTIQEALTDNDPLISGAASSVANGMVAAFMSKDPNMREAGNRLLQTFQQAMAEEDPNIRNRSLATAQLAAATLSAFNPEAEMTGGEFARRFQAGIASEEEAVKSASAHLVAAAVSSMISALNSKNQMLSTAVQGILNATTKSGPVRSQTLYSPEPPTFAANTRNVAVPALMSAEAENEPIQAMALPLERFAQTGITRAVRNSALKTAVGIEQRVSATLLPNNLKIDVHIPDGTVTSGPTINQTNNFYSPEALTPAETARLNRINTRRTLQALR